MYYYPNQPYVSQPTYTTTTAAYPQQVYPNMTTTTFIQPQSMPMMPGQPVYMPNVPLQQPQMVYGQPSVVYVQQPMIIPQTTFAQQCYDGFGGLMHSLDRDLKDLF